MNAQNHLREPNNTKPNISFFKAILHKTIYHIQCQNTSEQERVKLNIKDQTGHHSIPSKSKPRLKKEENFQIPILELQK